MIEYHLGHLSYNATLQIYLRSSAQRQVIPKVTAGLQNYPAQPIR
jgi:hypothetical protein